VTLDMNYVRQQFPGLKSDWTFFDNAGGSQILKPVTEKINEYYFTKNVQLGGSYDVSVQAAEAVHAGRTSIAKFFNASRAEEVIIGPSATVLLKHLSQAMSSQFQQGDEIIVTNSDHESNIGPWLNLAEQGVTIKFWNLNQETYELDLAELDLLMTEKTRLVCFTHVSNVIGTINPVQEITRMVHKRGARVCVDGVAYAPHRAIDVQAWGVDYYVISLYKTFGPHQSALFGKYDQLLDLDNIYHFFFDKSNVPAKLEPGNVNFELTYGSSAILDYLLDLGNRETSVGSAREKCIAAYSSITDQERILGEHLLKYLRSRDDCSIIGLSDGNDPRCVPTISFTIDGKDPAKICKEMDSFKIALRFGDFYAKRLITDLGLASRNGVIRVSMTHYNTIEEVDDLIHALKIVLE